MLAGEEGRVSARIHARMEEFIRRKGKRFGRRTCPGTCPDGRNYLERREEIRKEDLPADMSGQQKNMPAMLWKASACELTCSGMQALAVRRNMGLSH